MNCPKCHSANTRIEMIQTSSKATHKGTGLMGHTNNAMRGITAVSTLGMSNLVWKKSKGSSRSKFKHVSVAVCQDCGSNWKIK